MTTVATEKGRPMTKEERYREEMKMQIPTIDMEMTGKNIKTYRKDAGLSVKDIQMAIGFTNPQAVYKWERGLSLPTIDNLVILSALFGVKINDILAIN